MKFGVHSFLWSAGFGESDVGLFALAKQYGFDGLEIPLFEPRSFPAAAVRRALEANRMECTVSAVMVEGLSLISEDAGVRRRARAHLADAIRAVADAGANLLVGPLYSPVGYLPGRRRTRDEWRWAVEAYRELTTVLDPNGVTLAIEPLNRFETYFLNTAADAVALAIEVDHPRVGVLLDTFHMNIEEKNLGAAYRLAGRHLKHVHACENDRGTPGTGHIEWNAVFAALREIGYDGWLTIESFGFALGGISAAASIWRDLESSPDLIAIEGIKFLKRMAARA
ncbi:MAG: sugar phosphate isomerase/epimerase family protein [Bryobacterales bacterium]|nr:sugar phosphate isomerase/epimerase [Bryobacteraceae bacterium]MDW8130891.1 sugar phosphate isomerase/epimerase family protein [Bryobacterales bacterium]